MSDDFDSHLGVRRQLIDDALAGCLDRAGDVPPGLMEAMGYALLGAGKRLRPLLVILACEAVGGSARAALPAACAVEMIHSYSLVHDDLPAMDDDDVRRGRPTCHKRFDEATAILVGDALLTLAFQILSEEVQPPELAAQCCQVLAREAGAAGMVAGQALDLASEGQGGAVADLERIHARKTAALFRAAARLGGLLGGAVRSPDAERGALARLDEYATHLGLAFQISDDLLDAEGSSMRTGKRVGKDAERGKLTYPGLLGIEESRRRLLAACERAIGSIAAFGPAALRLRQLVQLILERDR